MKRRVVWAVAIFVVLTIFPNIAHAAERKFQAEGCHAKVSATLQIKDGTAWKDVIAAQGWEAVAGCPDTNPYAPWAMADLAIGSTIRWYIYAPGAWDFYSSESQVQEILDPKLIRVNGGALSGASVADGNPSFYVNSWIDRVPDNFRSGFGWYSTAWPLTDTVIEGMQLGLSGSWVTPNNESEPASIAQQVCANAAEWVRADTINNGSRGFDLMQTIEGSLGWWGGQKFKTLMPKFTIGPVQDCYSNQLQGPGWNFFGFALGEDPTPRNRTGLVQISNRMLIPPDGLTLEPDFSGAQVGYSWMSLPLPTFDHAYNNMAGENSWTMFINSKNFKGPLVFIAPQFFADGLVKNPVQKGLTLDVKGGRLGSLAAEWASIPFYKYTDTAGTIYTKIPGLEFPVDAKGNFALSRDMTAYGSSAISDSFRSALASGGALPQSTNAAGIFSPLLNTQSPEIYQEGKILGSLSSSLAVKVFESRAAYGFSMGGDARLEKIPQYYKEVGSSRIVIKESEAPTALVNAKFGSLMQTSTHVYQEPSWWKQSPEASGDLTADLRDGSQVTYRWYKFVDQPSLQRFEMNAAEKAGIQGAIEKMQKEWNNFAMMKDPKVGSLVSFDEGLMVTPPKGLEIGYVPIVVKQKAADKSAVDRALAAIFSASNNIESIMKAAAAADKAAADKAAAELKAKQEAEAKAAAELKAKQEADAKAVAELKAKQEAEAKAAAELKAKQEADAKAAADKAAADKLLADSNSALAMSQSDLRDANAALVSANAALAGLQTQLSTLNAKMAEMQLQIDSVTAKFTASQKSLTTINAKLKKICAVKPKPKGC